MASYNSATPPPDPWGSHQLYQQHIDHVKFSEDPNTSLEDQLSLSLQTGSFQRPLFCTGDAYLPRVWGTPPTLGPRHL